MEMLKFTFVFIHVAVFCFCQDQLPPQMISDFSDLHLPESNPDKVIVKCDAKNGDIRYTWKKNGVEVQNSQIVGVDKTTGEISFHKIEIRDFGTYQCFASNQYGTALSNPFKVERAYLTSFGASVNDDVECEPLGLCTIKCEGRGHCHPESECRFEWKIGQGTENNVVTTERVAVGKNGDLHFLWLNATTDVTINGGLMKVYGCGVWNEVLKVLNKGSLTTIKVVQPNRSPKREPVGIDNTDDKVEIGRKGALTCIFKGKPVPSIRWLKPDLTEIKPNDAKFFIDDFGRKLVIRDAEEADEGEYRCLGTNDYGTNVTMRPFLNVTSPPFLNIKNGPQMENQIKPEGSDAIFSCDAISLQDPPEEPPSPPTWYKNGAIIKPEEFGEGKNYSLSDDKKVLTVKDVKKGVDTGSYQCQSENSEGVLFKDAFLSVVEPIIVSYPPEDAVTDIEINLGDTLNLGVFASTDPSLYLRYTWEYEGESSDPAQPVQSVMVDSNQYWTLFNGNKNLTIDTTVFGEDEARIFDVVGRYSVRVYHEHQSKTVSFRVFTNIEPTVIPQSPPPVQSASLWFLAVIFGIIVLIIVIILIVCMLFRNRGGVYLVDKKEVAAGHDPERELKDSGFHDLSRGDDDDYSKMDQVSLSDDFDKDVGSDDDSMADYDGDLNASKFNEDGSFIGLYGDKKSKTGGTTTV